MRECVDPGGNGATMNERGEGGHGLFGRVEDKLFFFLQYFYCL